MSGNDRIAKNTIFLYFRMLCTIVVSLYTSRIILQTLGVNDYGIYQTVGGVAGLLSYIINGWHPVHRDLLHLKWGGEIRES